MTNETTGIMKMNKAKLFFTLLCVAVACSTAAQSLRGHVHAVLENERLFFRAEPDMNSPVTDSISATIRHPVRYSPAKNYDLGLYTAKRFVLLEGAPRGWRKVGLEKKNAYANRYDKVEIEQADIVTRYVDEESFNKHVVAEYRVKNDSSRIAIYSAPDRGAKTGDSIASTYRGGYGGGDVPGYFYTRETGKDGWFALAGIEYVTHYENEIKTLGVQIPVLVPVPFYVTRDRVEEEAEPYLITLGPEPRRVNPNAFPLWIFWLTVAGIVFMLLGRFRIFLQLPLLTVIFAMELHYFMIREKDFWWCEFDTMGWFKAILFFLLSLGAIFMQFKMFFSVLGDIKAMSRPFNTFIGTILYAAFIIVMLVYAIFAGEVSNRMLITVSLIFLVVQEIIIIAALRKNPVAMAVTMIFLPLGMFALVITSLKFFAVLALFTIVGLVFYAWAMSSGDGSGGTYKYGADDSTIIDGHGNILHRVNDSDLSDSDTVNYRGKKYR
jgi:hypothetical protein